jgi:hypothetical protein
VSFKEKVRKIMHICIADCDEYFGHSIEYCVHFVIAMNWSNKQNIFKEMDFLNYGPLTTKTLTGNSGKTYTDFGNILMKNYLLR